MTGKAKPFIQILRKRNFPLSRWSILKTLVLLAILKRTFSQKTGVRIRLGKFIIHGPDYAILSFLIKEKFVNQEYYFHTTNPYPFIIDCGANIGVSLIYFKCLYPNAMVHCFEPYSKAFYFLEKNVSANKIEKVFLHRKAISDTEEEVNLYIPESLGIINSGIENIKPHAERVHSIRLSQILENIPTINLIKIDIEGTEYRVMQDLLQSGVLSKEKIKRFIIEYHYDKRNEPERLEGLIEILKSNGYSVFPDKLLSSDVAGDLILNAWISDEIP